MPKVMRILFLITTLGRGGTERNLVQYCKHLDRGKYLPEVWYLHETKNSYRDTLEKSGVKVVHQKAPPGFNLWFLFKLGRRLKHCGADLIHVFLPTVAYHAVISRLIFRSKIPMMFFSGGIGLHLPLQKQMMRYGIGRYCYPIICNSESVKAFWEQSIGVSPDRLKVIPNGHNIAKFTEPLDQDKFRSSIGVGSDEKLIVTVGRMLETKRHVDVVRSFSVINQEYPNAILLIVGSGDTASLQNEIKQLGLDNSIRLMGHRDDVVEILRCADLFIFGSESEGLPNAVIEAALAQLPIVATNIPPIKSIVTDRHSACLVEPRNPSKLASCALSLLENPNTAQDLANQAYKDAVSRFDIYSVVHELENAYLDALADHRR